MKFADYLNSAQVCEHLGISRPTLDRWLALGLPSHQVRPRGRRLYVQSEIDAWIGSRWSERRADGGAA